MSGAQPPTTSQVITAMVEASRAVNATAGDRTHMRAVLNAALGKGCLMPGKAADLRGQIANADAECARWMEVGDAYKAERDAQAPKGAWLIRYEEAGIPDELFTSEGAWECAARRFELVQTGYNCHLFALVASNMPQLRALLAVAPIPERPMPDHDR